MTPATHDNSASDATNPPIAPWPSGGLEHVACCPLCASQQRETLYERLVDRVYRCAPGQWSLHRCGACDAAYLDPRPTRDTVALAYDTYYTHDGPPAPVRRGGRLANVRQAIRRTLRSAVLGVRLGYPVPALFRLCWALALAIPGGPAGAQRFVRNLPYSRNDRLLDVGCGSGGFLARMNSLGWQASGIDPDASAVAVARAAGLDAHVGELTEEQFGPETFGAVTLNHVIEHVHAPATVLRHCYRVLRPGGLLSIATPNLDALGHRLFRENWLALDPPRHLVLFTHSALVRAVTDAGFELLPDPPPSGQAAQVHGASARLATGAPPFGGAKVSAAVRARALLADASVRRRPRRAEEIVLVARRPSDPSPRIIARPSSQELAT